jgi:hypothetical protein
MANCVSASADFDAIFQISWRRHPADIYARIEDAAKK